MAKQNKYKRSPWSGQEYKRSPSVEELTAESKHVLQQHPAIAKALRFDAMDSFIEAYKAKAIKVSRD